MDPINLLQGAKSNVDRYLAKINEDVVNLEEHRQLLTDQLKEIEGSLDIIRDLKANILKQIRPVTTTPENQTLTVPQPPPLSKSGSESTPQPPTPVTTTVGLAATQSVSPSPINPISVIVGALPAVKEEDGGGDDEDLELPSALLSAVMNAAKNKEG